MEAQVIDESETALSAVPPDAHLTKPAKEVLENARQAALALKEVIAHKRRPVIFRGEQYLQFEDWQTVGGFFGSSVATGDAEIVEIDGVKGFKARAHVIDGNGIEVSTAEAYCMKDEDNWKGKPLFQLASMAQTRAGAKALRNKFAWVAVLAGYSPTPAEEMMGDESHHDTTPSDVPVCPDCGGPMWDNRETKKGKQPDFKCKSKSCNKGVWLPKEPLTEGYSKDQMLRDEFFAQAEKIMIAGGMDESKRKEALGRLLLLSTDDMGKKVDELAETARKKASGQVENIQDKKLALMISDIKRDAPPDSLDEYLKEHFQGASIESLDFDSIQVLHDLFVVPF